MFSYVSLEKRVPPDHPLRAIRKLVDEILAGMSKQFDALYSEVGRPSIPPQRLLRALLLQVFYTIRSERLLMEELDYNLLYRWFVGLEIDDRVWDVTVYTKNRERLVNQQQAAGLMLVEHVTIDGTLIKAWASHKSFQRKDQGDGGPGAGRTDGMAERDAGLLMVADLTRMGRRRITLGADKAYDTGDFVDTVRELGATPHVAQNNTHRRSAIDERTTRHAGYGVSLSKRWLVEKPFWWMKQIGGLRKVKLRGLAKVEWLFVFACAAYNLLRIPKLKERCA
jgi:transposase